MPYTPVELRHVHLPRGLLGYRRDAVEQLLDDVADSFENVWRERGELEDKVETLELQTAELRRREELLANALVAAEQAAKEVRDHAKRESELIVAEAHQEARSITRAAQNESARLSSEARRVEALLRAALGMVGEGGHPAAAETETPDSAPESAAEPKPVEPWPRREDTREFPRPVRPAFEQRSEPEARAG
jgi:cell division septum initiation protein DivIVA